MNIYSLKANIKSEEVTLLSILNPETDTGIPLNQKCIVGRLIDNNIPAVPGNIEYNKAFIDHLHKTIVFFSQFSDQMINLSESASGGFIYVLDQRNKEIINPKEQDIIGSFEVKHGAVVSGSYVPNPLYIPISEDGAFVLQSELEELLLKTAY